MLHRCDLCKVPILHARKISNLNHSERRLRAWSLSFPEKDMAKLSGNPLANGLRGKIGQHLVFRVMRGKTYVSVAAGKPDKKKETQRQRDTRNTFREASRRAKAMLLDPEKKQYYQDRAKALKLPNAYTAAVKEMMMGLCCAGIANLL